MTISPKVCGSCALRFVEMEDSLMLVPCSLLLSIEIL